MNAEFPKLLNVSVKSHLLSLGYSEKVINEIVRSSLVVNYGQDINIHSFVGSVAVAGADFDLWSVKGGNKQVSIANCMKRAFYTPKDNSIPF